MHQIIRKFEFDYGHRVLGHEGACASLHGHRGVAEVMLSCDTLDDVGRVIDFGEVKTIIGNWIDNNWDHRMILHADDPLLEAISELHSYQDEAMHRGTERKDYTSIIFGPRSPYILPNNMNPTAENMVIHLKSQLQLELKRQVGRDEISEGIKISQIQFWETPNCSAIVYA